jgi:PA14 domain
MRRYSLVLPIFVCLLVQSLEAATISWDPNTEPDIAGYLLSYGTASGQYTTTINVGNVTTFHFSEPNPAIRYYLAVRAYNTSGAISGYSNEVSTTPQVLTVTGLSSNRLSPQPVGTSIMFSAIATGGVTPHQFKWWIFNGTSWTMARQWSTSNTFTWTPTSANSSYIVHVWARNANSTQDAADNPAAVLSMNFVITAGTTNQPPTVNAGPDKNVTLPAAVTLNGAASDDGKPTPPGALTLSWSRVSGPGTVSFGTPSVATTTATFSAAGTYLLRLTATDSVLSSSDDVTVIVNPGSGVGTGLTGQYYNDGGPSQYFTTWVVNRMDPSVNFDWSASPAAGVQANNFSVRWTGKVLAPATGSYRFATTSDDGVQLWVNGQLVINNWSNHSATVNVSPPITLTAGVRYDIRLEFYERTGRGLIQLRWTPPGQAESVIPATRLFP